MREIAIDPEDPQADRVREAAAVLDGGGILAFPTETVYGLGVRGDLPASVARLKALKSRPDAAPFSLHIGNPAQMPLDRLEVPPAAQRLMARFWPGPLTLVLPLREGGTLGVRYPAHAVARAVLSAAGGPVLATSANPRGEAPPASAEEVRLAFPGGQGPDALLDGGRAVIRQASTVVSVSGDTWTVLREGLVTREMVGRALARRVLFVCTGNSCRSPMAKALFELAAARHLGCRPQDLLWQGVLAESAGTSALGFGEASPHAVKVVKTRGGDLSRHVPTPLTRELLEDADAVYAMSRVHVERIARLSPRAAGIVRLLAPDGGEMADPIGGSEDEYRACARLIDAGIEAILGAFLSSPRPRERRPEG